MNVAGPDDMPTMVTQPVRIAEAQPGSTEAPGGASGSPPGPPARFPTRRRLLAAFLALAAVFVSAFVSQLTGLRSIDEQLAALADHDEQMRLTLELENAIRSEFSHQAHFLVGEDAHLAGYRDARASSLQLITSLRQRLDEPESLQWLAEVVAAHDELDRTFQERIAPAVLNRDPSAMLTHDKTYALVHQMEQSLDRLAEFLRGEVVEHHVEVKKLARVAFLLAVAFLVGTPVLALGIAAYLSRLIVRPLAALGDGAARVAAGDLGTRIRIETRDEFAVLADEFNAMTAALKDNQDRIVRSEKLASLGRMAAGIAHELNTPLQVVLGYLSLDKHRVKGELARHFEAMEKATTRCMDIVEQVLHLSRPTIGSVREPVDLSEVAAEVASTLQLTLGEGTPRLLVEGRGTALGSRSGLHQVAFILGRNAAEAAQPGGEVRMTVSAGRDEVELAVSDTGPGVPAELQGRIFEPFFTTKAHGIGLGLPIARAIAHAMGGDIEFANREGGGARFTLRVPRAAQGAS